MSRILFTEGGGLVRGVPRDPPGTATAAGGTHPTGMHSRFTPPGRLLLRAVRILLECILVLKIFGDFLWFNLAKVMVRVPAHGKM